MSNFLKIHPLGMDLCHAGGRTDRQTNDEASIRFLQFCERAQKVRNNVVINTLDKIYHNKMRHDVITKVENWFRIPLYSPPPSVEVVSFALRLLYLLRERPRYHLFGPCVILHISLGAVRERKFSCPHPASDLDSWFVHPITQSLLRLACPRKAISYGFACKWKDSIRDWRRIARIQTVFRGSVHQPRPHSVRLRSCLL